MGDVVLREFVLQPGVFHVIEHNGDKEIDDDKDRNHDVTTVVNPRPRIRLQTNLLHLDPALQCKHLEQRQQRAPERTPVCRVMEVEEVIADNAVHVE